MCVGNRLWDERASEATFQSAHLSPIGLMIVTAQMQDAVDDQVPQLPIERNAPPRGVSSRRLHRDDDVAEIRLRLWTIGIQLAEREGEDIGGSVNTSEVAIELADRSIADEHDRDRVPAFADGRKDALGELRQSSRLHAISPLTIHHENHRSTRAAVGGHSISAFLFRSS